MARMSVKVELHERWWLKLLTFWGFRLYLAGVPMNHVVMMIVRWGYRVEVRLAHEENSCNDVVED